MSRDTSRRGKAKPKPRGICCPTCGERLYQVRTVRRADGSIQRKRKCPTCPHAVVTFERVQGGRG